MKHDKDNFKALLEDAVTDSVKSLQPEQKAEAAEFFRVLMIGKLTCDQLHCIEMLVDLAFDGGFREGQRCREKP